MRNIFIGAAALMLAACQPTPSDDSDPSGDVTPSAAGSAQAPEPVASGSPADQGDNGESVAIIGEYRLAGYDGKAIDLPHGVAVSITANRIRYTSQCVAGTWSYSRNDDSFVTERVPEVICQRGLYPEEQAMDAVFDGLRSATIDKSNGMQLSGGGHSVTLFSQ